ncbi:uncharacterized protein LOC119689565 [Teleopsis dalmanni]|uniref:uncharacterized protein LOC119689565 n=1 Tax=Teleopsis dalmanni TaxID=139649 RepID=UPI0018CEE051|nr:uncharacterized protein LOC119689565 [Teleopsis dalmanni]
MDRKFNFGKYKNDAINTYLEKNSEDQQIFSDEGIKLKAVPASTNVARYIIEMSGDAQIEPLCDFKRCSDASRNSAETTYAVADPVQYCDSVVSLESLRSLTSAENGSPNECTNRKELFTLFKRNSLFRATSWTSSEFFFANDGDSGSDEK